MKAFQIRPLNKDDKMWVNSLLKEWWAGPKIVTRGKLYQAGELPGFIAVKDSKPAGLLIYHIAGDQCEVVTMNSLIEKIGIGSALLDVVKKIATDEGCKRLCLITTNDNTAALRFWQKRGFQIAAVHINAVENSRRLKPEIPLIGNDEIPIRDEIELEMYI